MRKTTYEHGTIVRSSTVGRTAPQASSSGHDGSSSSGHGRADGVGTRSRALVAALLAVLVMFAAGVTTAVTSDLGVASNDQTSQDGTGDVDVALFRQIRAVVNGATWS